MIRINRFIAESGMASRRGADRMVEEGRVTINGHVANAGDKVSEGDEVLVDGVRIHGKTKDIVIAFNKPVGIVCTANRDDPDNIVDFIGYPERIYTIGRLDKDSEGLILLTNNGDLANAVMRSRNEHEKEYHVTVDHDITDGFLRKMSEGVNILGRVTKPCEIVPMSNREFRIILRQGLNRQIRRMCGSLGYTVVSLKRVRVINILLGDLPTGEYRNLTEEEKEELCGTIRKSGNRPNPMSLPSYPSVAGNSAPITSNPRTSFPSPRTPDSVSRPSGTKGLWGSRYAKNSARKRRGRI